jgi:hypothetical protein
MSSLRKFSIASCAAAAVTLLAAFSPATHGIAADGAARGAVVIHNGVCDIGPGGYVIDGWTVTQVVGVAHQVISPSGNITITCKAQLDRADAPPSARHLAIGDSGEFPCYFIDESGIFYGGTQGKQTWSANGNVTATCQFKAKD